MSVIPFILDNENKTVVATREEYESAGGLEGEVIFVQNLDKNQITEATGSNASYDLRIGNEYRDHRDSNKTELSDDGFVCLQPGAAVIIETVESVQFPKSRFGHIVPKVSLLQEGLSNTSSKIDPGYFGKLLITVFNLGKRKIRLKKGQRFCTLYVLEIKKGVSPYKKESKRITGKYEKTLLNNFRDLIETNQTLLTASLILFTMVLTIIQIVELLQGN